MIDEKRIEEAAKASWYRTHGTLKKWEDVRVEIRRDRIERARVFMESAFPELRGENPSHWLAPVEPTGEMCDAIAGVTGGTNPALGWFAAMYAWRDAHIKEKQT